MDTYELGEVLAEGPSWKAYAAWSTTDQRDVIVKVYERSGIMSAESLVKEGIRQAREKEEESAVLTSVMFAPTDDSATDSNFTVNFILEKRAREVSMDIIERDDGTGSYPPGLSEYELGEDVPVVANSRIRLGKVKATGEDVIIKSILNIRDIVEANTFIREAFTMAYIEHERNCRLIDICFEKPEGKKKIYHVHLVLERMEKDVARDIEDRREDDRFYTEEEILNILLDSGAGLAQAKRLHIAHRDIKPLNIFLGFDNRAKLGDFGSTWKKAQQTFVATGAGTIGYVSPEMREAMINPYSVEVDPFSSDVFSLGVTLLHMALLKFPPNLDASVKSVLEKNLKANIDQIQYRDGLKQLIKDMVAYEPNFRPKLEAILLQAEELLQQIPSSGGGAEEQQKAAMCRLTSTTLQFFDFDSKKWMDEIKLDSPLSVDEGTFYTVDNNTIYYFGNIREEFTGREAGAIECHGSEYVVKKLPDMKKRRACLGGVKFRDEFFAFGGNHHELVDLWKQLVDLWNWNDHDDDEKQLYDKLYDQFVDLYEKRIYDHSDEQHDADKSAEVLSLSSPPKWTSLPEMSEGKLRVCPVLFREKFYLCGFKNIDVFDPFHRCFDSVLPLQIPEERWTDRVACIFKNQILIITRTLLHRISFLPTGTTITTTKHGEQEIRPASSAVVSGSYLYWQMSKGCRKAALRQGGKIEEL